MPNRLRIGIVGVGALALRGIIPHLTQRDVQERVEVFALCDPIVARAESVAKSFGIPRTYSAIEELLADNDVDLVTIASPIGLHYDHCKLALMAGKHVHVNKTMTTSRAQADDLIALAKKRELKLIASPGEQLRPQVIRARELIAEGAIGDVCWAICGQAVAPHLRESERVGAPGSTSIDPAWYFRSAGGGPLYDTTVYSLHQMTSILGPARRVTALSGVRIRERSFMGKAIPTEADDNTILSLDFGENLFAVAHGTAAGSHSNQFGAGTYFGTKGVIDGLLLNGERFEFPGCELTLDAPVSDWNAQMRVLPHVKEAHWNMAEAHVFEDIMQLVDWIIDDVPSLVTAEQARHVIEIIESGYRAARTGEAQDLVTTFKTS